MENSGEALTFAVQADQAGTRLDKIVVALVPNLGRAGAARLFGRGLVSVRGEDGAWARANKGDRAQEGTQLQLHVAAADVDSAAQPDPSLTVNVVAETPDWVIVNKVAGQHCAPLKPGELGTLANGLLARFPEMADVGYSKREPGLCHRLDFGTSGLVLAARNAAAFGVLAKALRGGQLDKRYLLVCEAHALKPGGTIAHALGPDPSDRRRVAVDEKAGARARDGVSATRFQVLERAAGRALVEARVSRAYRHQIRAHFAAEGAPLLGDELYGGAAVEGLTHHALHASRIAWPGGESVPGFDETAELPTTLRRLLA